MDGSIVVLIVAEYVAQCDSVVVEMFALRTDYHSGTCIHIRQNFSEWQVEHPCGLLAACALI